MNRAAAFSLLIFAGSITSIAQSSAPGAQSTVMHWAPVSASCPVDMRAQHIAGPGTLIAAKHHDGEGVAQQLHLTLNNSKPVAIIGAQITVHGFSSTGSLTPARSGQADSPEITTTINLKLTVGAHGNASTDLSLSGFTAVSLIELNSVSYADGLAWRASGLQTCHVAPDPIMPISSR